MNNFISQLLILFLIIFSFVGNVKAIEKVQPIFDDRSWELGWSQNQGGAIFEEYILKGEEVESWSELVTIQFFPGLQNQTNPDVYEGVLKTSITNVCPDVIWETLNQNEESRMWTWTVKNCPGQPDQSEIARLIKTDKGFHVLHYAIKSSPIPADKKKTWMSKLQEMEVEY